MKRCIVLTLALLFAIICPLGSSAFAEEQVTLTISGSWPDFRALDEISRAFTAKYPNCTIVYEYLQNSYETLETRLNGDEPVDMFLTTNIQEGSAMLPYALDLFTVEGLDISQTFDGLISNFALRGTYANNIKLYAIPLGAEMRGLYVNVTLLKSLGLETPENQAELLYCCEVLTQNGYIPFHGNPGNFSQVLMYPWICNIIVNSENADEIHARVEACAENMSELFMEPLEFLYMLMEKGYYDYKKAQTDLGLFLDASDEAYSRDFLNIVETEEGYVKLDDVGRVAFMPSPMSMGGTVAKTREDYHSEIEYVFIPAPLGVDGGFAYMSPAHGIAVFKDSKNLEWAIKFLDFLFEPDNNKLFAQAFNVIPNTRDAISYISDVFDVSEDRISELGQVTFSYAFYETLVLQLTDLSKGNNPKYMYDDGSGNLSLYPLEYYTERFDAAYDEIREGGTVDQ